MCSITKNIRFNSISGPQEVPIYQWYPDECTDSIAGSLSCLLVNDDQVPDLRVVDEFLMKISALILVAQGARDSTQIYRRVGLLRFEEFPQDVFEAALTSDFILV